MPEFFRNTSLISNRGMARINKVSEKMRTIMILASIIFLNECSPPRGHQAGKYAVGTSSMTNVEGYDGLKIYLVDGERNLTSGHINVSDPIIPLVGIIFSWNPKAHPLPLQYSTTDGAGSDRYLTTIHVGHHEIVTEIVWDRRSGKVRALGKDYRFTEGMILHVVQLDDGSVHISELPQRLKSIDLDQFVTVAKTLSH